MKTDLGLLSRPRLLLSCGSLNVVAGVVVASLGVVGCFVATSCAVPEAAHRSSRPRPASSSLSTEEVDASVLAEARKTAAQTLECPDDAVTVTCTRRDLHGGCVAVEARGCDKMLDYDFGNER
jgi:hypothetical protein